VNFRDFNRSIYERIPQSTRNEWRCLNLELAAVESSGAALPAADRAFS